MTRGYTADGQSSVDREQFIHFEHTSWWKNLKTVCCCAAATKRVGLSQAPGHHEGETKLNPISHSILAIVVLGLMLVTGSLSAQDASKPAVVTELPGVALPPDLDRVLRDYERAWRAGDAAALASLFAEDGFVLQSDRPPIRGRPAIQAAYEGQGEGGLLRLRALAFTTADTIGLIIGAYSYGNKPGDTGKFTLTLRRAPGEPWLIFSDMDNLNAKPRQPNGPDVPLPTESPAAGR